jgi:hypothetical protein
MCARIITLVRACMNLTAIFMLGLSQVRLDIFGPSLRIVCGKLINRILRAVET